MSVYYIHMQLDVQGRDVERSDRGQPETFPPTMWVLSHLTRPKMVCGFYFSLLVITNVPIVLYSKALNAFFFPELHLQ